MTIDVPVGSPKGKVLTIDLSNSFIEANEEENAPHFKTSETNGIPVVVLKKLDTDNEYYVVSPRSSIRCRTIKSVPDFKMDISTPNLKKIGNGSASPRKRGRPRKYDPDLEMLSPTKLQKTPKNSNKGHLQDNLESLCTSVKNSVNIITPIKKSLNEMDSSDIELIENSPSPRNKETQDQTPIQNTPKHGKIRLPKFNKGSPIKIDENNDTALSPVRSVKISLDESFRRSVLKSALNLENVRTTVKTERPTGRYSAKSMSTKSKRTVRQSYASYFLDDSDSDHKKQSGKVGSAKRRILRTRSNCTSNLDDLQLEDESESNDDYDKNIGKRILRSRKGSTSSNFSEKSEVSPDRRPQRKVVKTPRTFRDRKDSATSNASDKSPEKRPPMEVAKTPKTPRDRRSAAVTPKSVKVTPKTPKNRLKLLRDGVITPSMHSRSSIIPGDSTPLMKARSQLHVSYVPTSLPCREKEYLDVYNFLRGKLDDGYGGCMYISGVPGTGKTATVTSVIDSLQNDRTVQEFSYVSVNGMRLTEPRQSYVEIWKQLTGKTIPWEQAQSLLEERFTKKKKTSPVVMLIDELDILCTKRQDVVYNLLDWPAKSVDQLIVITIANTMDLPERLLMSRVTSRLGLTRLTFQAYTHKQLMEIVTKRLTGTNSFNPDAIQLVARKVASVSGDARRALDICRRAAEIAEDEGKGQFVNIMHINEALNAMITQPQVMAIRRCSRLQKLLLQAIVAEIERTGVEETTFSDVFRILVSCCALDGFKMVSSTVALRAICELSAYRLIITDQKCSNIYQRIILNVSVHDVYFALKKD